MRAASPTPGPAGTRGRARCPAGPCVSQASAATPRCRSIRWPSTSSSSQAGSRGQARASASWAISHDVVVAVTSRAATSRFDDVLPLGVGGSSRRGTLARTGSPSVRGGHQAQQQLVAARGAGGWSATRTAARRIWATQPPDAAGGLVAGDGQGATLPALPGPAQRVREQRQRARLALHLPHQQVDQAGLEEQPGRWAGPVIAARSPASSIGPSRYRPRSTSRAIVRVLRPSGRDGRPAGRSLPGSTRLGHQPGEEPAPLLGVRAER